MRNSFRFAFIMLVVSIFVAFILVHPVLSQQTNLFTIWSPSAVPAVPDQGPDYPLELGVRFRSDVSGMVVGVRFYKSSNNLGPHTGSLWDNNGNLLATATFSNETASGWQQVTFSSPVSIAANTTYVASYHTSTGHESLDNNCFSNRGVDSPPLHALQDWEDGSNGAYTISDTTAFPTSDYQGGSNFWVDVVFEPSAPRIPVQIAVTPSASSLQAGAMQPFTATATYEDNTTQDITMVATWGSSNTALAIVNSAGIAQGVGTGTVTISASYQGLTGSTTLQVQPLAQFCPCTIWSPSTVPSIVDQGPDDPLELGVKFHSDVDGLITGIRFYKSSNNTGVHVGNLWDANGALLATATFTNETNSGWQQVDFAIPVAIIANTVYVASYHTNAGHESLDNYAFYTQATDVPPLHTLWDFPGNSNGVYSYGATSVFPTTGYEATNFWVDVVFEASFPPAPTVINVTPLDPVIQVATAQQLAATATFQDTTSHDITEIATWTSSDPNLATVSSSGSVQPLGPGSVTIYATYGNVTGSTTLLIHTLSNSLCPCSIWNSNAMPAVPDSGDQSASEVGVKLRSDVNGTITGVRFYKSAANTGTHIGSLWTIDGTLLARATFENETASGWQQVNFDTAVQITANTDYLASYHTDVGHEPQEWGYFYPNGVDNPPIHALANGQDGPNGVCATSPTPVFPDCEGGANYWVDIVFMPSMSPNQAPAVNAGPNQTITLPTNSVTLNGSATDDGLPNGTLLISWSVLSGPGTVTFANPSSAVTQATFSGSGTYVLQLSANDSQLTSNSTMTVTVNPVPFVIILAPAFAGPNVAGTTQKMTATVTLTSGSPAAGVIVQFVVTGANVTSGSSTTDSTGVAIFAYVGSQNGSDSVQASSGGKISNIASISWITPIQPISTTSASGRFFSSDANACNLGIFDAGPNTVPAFTQEFPTINFNPPAGTIPGNTSSVGDYTRPFTDVTTDPTGNFTGTIVAQGNGLQAGVASLNCFQAVFTGSFTVAHAGNVSINLYSDDGFILGISGGATRVSGPMVNAPTSGLTPFQQYTVVGAYNEATIPVGNVELVNFPAPGTYPYELDYTECCGGYLTLTMAIGATGSTGTAPTGSLSITPLGPTSIQTGQVESLTVKVTDGSGLPVPNLSIGATVNGPNQMYLTATTNSSGVATLQYVGFNGGTDTVQAVANIGNMYTFSNIVGVPWTLQSGGTGTAFAPQGWISLPNTVIQGMEEIDVAPGITLASGVLEYWPTSNPNAITVLNANTTGNGAIGTFDGTAIPSGGYTLQLTATTTTGVSAVSIVPVVVTGQLKLGRVTKTVTDFKVPLAGIPISIARTYDSLTRAIVGDFGNGWTLAAQADLTVDAFNNVTFRFNQQNITFNFSPQPSSWLFPWLLSPTYLPAPGNHGSLTSDGCNQVVQVQSNVVCFPSTAPYQPATFIYTDPSGRVYTIAATGQIQSIRDQSGNTLTFSATGITSSIGGGVVIPFVRDTQNRITQITDLNGNNYLYTYDSPCGTGNLCSVGFPGLSAPATYTYTADHNIATEADPNGNTTTSTYYVTSDYKNGRLKSLTGPTVTGPTGNPTQYVTQYAYNICFWCGPLLPKTTIQTTVTNPDGGVVVTNYDPFGQPLNVTDALNRTTNYVYDGNENLVSATDPLTNTTTYTYDVNGFQTSVADPLQHTTTQTNNQFGEILTITDAAGTNTKTATYDASFNLTQVTDLENGPNSPQLSRTYDSAGNILTNTDANGNTTQYQYDSNGNLTQITDPLNGVTCLTYDSMGRVLSEKDPRGHTTQWTYDALGNVASKSDPLTNVTTYTYDGNGNRLSETDALQRTTYFQYDNLNRLTQITYPTSPVTTRKFTYDFRNNKLTETDQAGRVTKWVYDAAGQLRSVTYAYGTPDAGTIQYTYDAAGRQKTIVDERGNTTTYTYDAATRLTAVQDPTANPPTMYTYDADNRVTTVQDPNGNAISYAYYPRNWVKTITYPATSNQPATTKQFTYDGMGRVITTTDQAGNIITDSYDALGRLTSVQDALQNLTRYTYDPAGNLTKITDANNNATIFQYDSLNRKTLRGLPLGMTEGFSYDPVGNLTAHTDFNGKTTGFAYDPVNRLLSKVPDPSLSQPTITFTYNSTGTRQTMTDATGTTNYTYDNRNRLKSKATPEGTLNYTYDAHGNVLTIGSSNANGASATYTYDVLNRLSTATDNRLAAQGIASPVTTYGYDPAGNLAGYTYAANGLQSVYAYDALNRLNQLTWNKSGTSLSSFTYAPYPAGNIHTVAELSGRNVSYGYDNNYRLQNETIASDPDGNNGTEGYTYDNVGNRLTLNSTIPTLSGTASYAYDPNDRLTADSYDANGNTISSSGVSYTYDFENRLLMKGAIVTVYDGDGNRVSETAGGVTTKYLAVRGESLDTGWR